MASSSDEQFNWDSGPLLDVGKAPSMACFVKERKLGQGGYGRVYLVKDKKTEKWCAIKIVKMSRLADIATDEAQCKKLEAMVLKEAAIVQQIDHANVVKVYESFMESGRFHIVMEYCDGGTLKNAIVAKANEGEDSFFREEQICYWMAQIAMAVSWLHSRNILHRDIKAENIFLLGEDGRKCKLGDFGIARELESSDEGASTAIGTPSHMAPEMLSGQRYGFKTEVWAFGVVAYHLATLKLPFSFGGRNFIAMAHAVATAPIAPISETIYSQGLRDLIERKMLVRDVDQRATIADVSEDPCLREHIKSLEEEAKKLEVKQTSRRPSNSDVICALSEKVELATKKLEELEAKLLASEQRAAQFELRWQKSLEDNRLVEQQLRTANSLEMQTLTVKVAELEQKLKSKTGGGSVKEKELYSEVVNESQQSAILLKCGVADVKQKELFEACFQGDTSRARTLLKEHASQVDINAKYDEAKHGEIGGKGWQKAGMTCLQFATMNGKIDTVAMLIREFQPIVDHQNEEGRSAIHVAALISHIGILRLLCEEGHANLEVKTKKHGYTALMIAVARGNTECVEYLLERGAKANERSSEGKTVLALTNSDTIKALLAKHGAALETEDKHLKI